MHRDSGTFCRQFLNPHWMSYVLVSREWMWLVTSDAVCSYWFDQLEWPHINVALIYCIYLVFYVTESVNDCRCTSNSQHIYPQPNCFCVTHTKNRADNPLYANTPKMLTHIRCAQLHRDVLYLHAVNRRVWCDKNLNSSVRVDNANHAWAKKNKLMTCFLSCDFDLALRRSPIGDKKVASRTETMLWIIPGIPHIYSYILLEWFP